MANIIEYEGKHRLFNDTGATVLSFQLDQNTEEKIFRIPRYQDDFDLSEFTCYLLLSGAGWTDRVELSQKTVSDQTISFRWTVSALATSTGKPVVFQPVFYKDPVVLHLDKDIFTISTSIDTNSEIETYYPDYISGLTQKADKSALENYYTKTVLDAKFSEIDTKWENIVNAGNFPNLLINASGLIWQRGTSFNLTLNSTIWQYCDDRWRYKLTGTVGAAAVISKGINGGTSISIVGGGTVVRQQVMEQAVTGTLSQSLNGGTITSAPFSGTVVEQTFTASTLVDWVKLETSESATPFSPRLFGEELTLCQRYYEKSYNYSDVAGTDTMSGAVFESKSGIASGQTSIGTQYAHTNYVVVKRTTPVVTLYSKVGTVGKISKSGGVDLGANITASSDTRFNVQTIDTILVGDNLYFHFTADAEFYD